MKSRSPSACAAKSYSATTYCTAGFGFGLSGGGGGGAFFAAAAAPKPDPGAGGEYGGGAADAAAEAPREGDGGGSVFLNEEPEGERLPSEELVEAARPTPRLLGPPDAARFACTIRAGRGAAAGEQRRRIERRERRTCGDDAPGDVERLDALERV